MTTIPTFNYAQVSADVRRVLQMAFGSNVAIRTEEGEHGTVFVRIVSDHFDGLSERAKQDKIWKVLRRELKADAQAVALVMAFGTDQI